MDPDVIAINIVGPSFFDRRIEMKTDTPLQLFLKAVSGPAIFEEQKT